MLIYGALLSPYVRKVCVIAAEKGLPFEMKFTPRGGTDAEFLAISPAGKIPALRDGDYALADSSAIAAYLDAQYPAIGLIPAEARARGRVVWFDEYADTVLGASGLKVLFHRLVAPKLLKLPYDEAVAEQGVAGYDVRSWAGLMAPAGTPRAVIERLNAEVQKALPIPAVKARLEDMGGEVRGSTPDEMKTMVASQTQKWIQVVSEAKIPKQ